MIRPMTRATRAGILLLIVLLLDLPFTGSVRGQSQTDMNRQAEDAYRRSDQELNAVYTKLKKQLDSARQKKLIAAEKAWVAFRDAQADFVASEAEGGSMYPMLLFSAREAVTRDRIRQLQQPGVGPQP
jgi:uncharacterized protein YecT (DUF1311 family)